MPVVVLLFFAGILTSTQLKEIPSFHALIFLFCGCVLILIIGDKNIKYCTIPVLGGIWALLHAHYITRWTLPSAVENKPILFEGYVASIPVMNEQTQTFDFQVQKIGNTKQSTQFHLSWYHCPYSIHVGESWRLVAKIKRPHALRNPGCFDQEKNYFYHHLRGQGNIIQDARICRLPSTIWHMPIERLREKIKERLLTQFKQNEYHGILLALTIGITREITAAQWKIFRETGTNHLVAISGLHIGLVAYLFAKIAATIWNRFSYGPLICPTLRIEALAGWVVATIYSVLAGFSPATQRAWLMIACFVLATLLKRRVNTFRSLLFALGIILLFDPFAILEMGFWLSFIAVSLLIYGMGGRLSQKGPWVKWGKPQWVIGVGMAPTLLMFFQQTPLLSVAANIVAIPWISFLVVPCFLVGVILYFLSKSIGGWILKLGISFLTLIWHYLAWLSTFPSFIWHAAFEPGMMTVVSHLAAYITLLPTCFFPQVVAAFWWLPYLMPLKTTLPANGVQLVVFDVGQGLAALIRTQHHTLIFDTGSKLNQDFDMGKVVIIPYLLQASVKKIDILTISHGDNDHIGGAESLLKSVQVVKIYSSVPERFTHRHVERCLDTKKWQWDGVDFAFLSPFPHAGLVGNNASCVLRVSNGKQSILLTGDIEKQVESILLQRHKKMLPASIIIVPHHGSKTSSTKDFLKAVAPKYAIFSTGYLNSYHHPHLVVLEQYKQNKSKIFNTTSSGAITMTLLPHSNKVIIDEYRKSHKHIWHGLF